MGIVKAVGCITLNFLSFLPWGAALSHEKPWLKWCLPSVSNSSIQGGGVGMEQGKEAPPLHPHPLCFPAGMKDGETQSHACSAFPKYLQWARNWVAAPPHIPWL